MSLKTNRLFLSSIFNIPEDSVVYFTKCLKLTKIYNFLRIHNKTKKTSTGGKRGGEQGEQGSRGRRGAGGGIMNFWLLGSGFWFPGSWFYINGR